MDNRTPDGIKPPLEGKFKKGQRPSTIPYQKRPRATNIQVSEPLMVALDEKMKKHGVSSARIEGALGLSRDRLKDMRHFDSAWVALRVVRQALWLMGYDLRFKLVKVGPLDKSVVMTMAQKKNKDVEKITGRKGKWEPQKMWAWLGLDTLEKSD